MLKEEILQSDKDEKRREKINPEFKEEWEENNL